MTEVFKSIPGYKDYQISNLGNVKSFKYKEVRILKSPINNNGYKYRRVTLCKNGNQRNFKIGRLILLTFIGSRPLGKETSHLNGNRFDDRLENLKWETPMENQQRKVEHNRRYT